MNPERDMEQDKWFNKNKAEQPAKEQKHRGNTIIIQPVKNMRYTFHSTKKYL